MGKGMRVVAGSLVILFGIVAIQGFINDPLLDIQDTELNIDENWDLQGDLNNLNTNSDIIYPSRNSEGTFISDIENVEKGTLTEFSYIADMSDGNGNVTVNGWENYSAGLEPNKTLEFDLETGNNTVSVSDGKQFNDFQVEIFLNETAGSENTNPNVDSFTATWGINKDFSNLISELVPFMIIFLGVVILLEVF